MNIIEIGKFISAGNAEFVLDNLRTHRKLVYRVRKHKDFDEGKRSWSVSLLLTIEGESAYGYIGSIANNQFNHNTYSILDDEHDSFNMFDWFFLQVVRGKELPEHILFSHLGRCGKCSKRLTDKESIKRGLGPICAKRAIA